MKNAYVKPGRGTFDCLSLIAIFPLRRGHVSYPLPSPRVPLYVTPATHFWICHAFLYYRKSLLRIPERQPFITNPLFRISQKELFLIEKGMPVCAITTMSQDKDNAANLRSGVLFLVFFFCQKRTPPDRRLRLHRWLNWKPIYTCQQVTVYLWKRVRPFYPFPLTFALLSMTCNDSVKPWKSPNWRTWKSRVEFISRSTLL